MEAWHRVKKCQEAAGRQAMGPHGGVKGQRASMGLCWTVAEEEALVWQDPSNSKLGFLGGACKCCGPRCSRHHLQESWIWWW